MRDKKRRRVKIVHQPRRGHVLGRDNGTRQEAGKPHAAEG
jgi:hypothetical protein